MPRRRPHYPRRSDKPSIPSGPPAYERWPERAAAWSAAHGMPAHLWLGPGMDPLPEPEGAHVGAPSPPEPKAAHGERSSPP